MLSDKQIEVLARERWTQTAAAAGYPAWDKLDEGTRTMILLIAKEASIAGAKSALEPEITLLGK